MDDEPREDPLLLDRLRDADGSAFETLVRLYGGRMLSTAKRFLRAEEDAADAVQEAFLSAFRNIGSFEGQSQVGTWLHRILVNACLMKLRMRSRHPELSIDSLLPAFDQTGHHVNGVRSWRQAPDEELQATEMRTIVRAAIDKLPDDFRTVVLLRDIEEMSTEEAAAALGISPGAAKVRLHRARQALRTLLEPHMTM
jgi:RNA polymerase sigma-70 factor (ECF subfamily)